MTRPHRSVAAEAGGTLPPRADVVVVGGGVAGAAAAFHLARAEVDVVLLERDRVGAGATAAAVGLLGPALRQPFDETVRFYGSDVATRVWWFAHRSAAGLADVLEGEGLADAVGLDRGGVHVLAASDTLQGVESAFSAMEDAGLPVAWMTAEEAAAATGTEAFVGGYRIDGPAALDGSMAAASLADPARAAGAATREEVEVRTVTRGGSGLAVDTDQGPLRAEMVVYATHVESRRFSAFLADEVVPVRGQGLVTEPLGLRRPGAFATHGRMNVWRQDPEGRLHLGGWRWSSWERSYWKVRPEVDPELQADLVGWCEGAHPQWAPLPVARRWGGIYGWTADTLPIVGPLPGSPRELVTAGFGGGGLSLAFDCGRAVAAIVLGQEPVPAAELFNPRRFA
ncbi:MAG: FAD-dependent oxidoreductase [Longimicrobiales bacterium]